MQLNHPKRKSPGACTANELFGKSELYSSPTVLVLSIIDRMCNQTTL